MPNFDVAGPALKKILKKAEQDSIAFAFNPGKSEEDSYFGMHPLKSPAILMKEAKEVGTGVKTAFGTARVARQEREFRLTCEMVVPGLAKKLKKFLKANKVNLNIIVMDADGTVLESDIEDLPTDADDPEDETGQTSPDGSRAETPAPAPAPAPAPNTDSALDPKALLQRLMAVRDQMKTLPEAAAARLIDPFKRTAALLKENALETAAVNIEKLEKALKQMLSVAPPPPPPPPANPMAEKLKQLALSLRAQSALLPDAERRAKIDQAIARAEGQIATDELREAAALLTKIRDLLKPPASATPPQPPEASAETKTAPSSEARWKQAYDIWLDANDALDKQLNALRTAILQETGYPEFADELAEIARVGLNALTGNNRVKLMAALQVLGPGDAGSIQQHGAKAISAIDTFKAYLDSNIKVDACEGNPWDVDVHIRGTLYPPLDRLSSVLQA